MPEISSLAIVDFYIKVGEFLLKPCYSNSIAVFTYLDKTVKSSTWDASELEKELQPLDWQQLPEASSAQQRYLEYYNIDFSTRYEDKGFRHHIGSFPAAGYQLAAQVFCQDRAKGTALIMHGYYDHVGIYGSLIDFCLQQGWNVFAFDLPGHGLSSGERASISDFKEYDDVLCAALVQVQKFSEYESNQSLPLHIFGQSTGGAIIINYLLTRGIQQANSPFQSINLLAPLVRPTGWMVAKIMHCLLKPFVRQIKRNFSINSDDLEFLSFISERDPLQPLALSVRWVGALKKWVRMIEASQAVDLEINIVQGTHDETVDWKRNMPVLFEKFPNRKLLLLENGRHQLVNETPEKRQQAYQWLQQQIDVE